MKLACVVGMSVVFAGAAAVAEQPRLVKDIATAAPAFASSSLPGPMVVLNGVGYFAATDANNFRQLWRTDGTPEGTRLAVNFVPYRGNVLEDHSLTPLGVLGNELLVAVTMRAGVALFATDGTGDGTRLVHEQLGIADPLPRFEAAVLEGVMYFAWTEGSSLWRTDGTRGGTSVAADIQPFGRSISELTVSGGSLYFKATTQTHGTELWVYNPDAGTARLLRDFSPSTTPLTDPWLLRDVNGRLFFRPLTPAYGREWWTTDGTDEGTRLVADMTPGTGSTSVAEAVALGNRVLFRRSTSETGAELWTTDGTAEGTGLVVDAVPGTGGLNPAHLRRVGPHVYFIGTTPDAGAEPWRTDGTAVGTFGIDALPGPMGSFGGGLAGYPTAVGSTLFYFGRAGSSGVGVQGLWRCDGTPEGTFRLADVQPLTLEGRTTDLNGRLMFVAGPPSSNAELWGSDGTASGTGLVKDIWAYDLGSSPTPVGALGGRLLFRAVHPGTGEAELFLSDGTAAGTFSPLTVRPEGRVSLAAVDGTRVFAVCEVTAAGAPAEVWVTDLTAEGTSRVATLETRGGLSGDSIVTRGGRAFFAHHNVPYASDGTAAGTVRLSPAWRPGGTLVAQRMMTGAWGVHFMAHAGSGWSVYRTDGTEAGTWSVYGSVSPLVSEAEGRLYASWSRDGAQGVSRETDAGTFESLAPTPRLFSPAGAFGSYRGRAVFAASAAFEGHSVYGIDPAEPTATLALGRPAGVGGFFVSGFAEAGDRLLMLAETTEHGTELWATDLTPAGTSLLADLVPGPGSAFPNGASDFLWTRVGDLLYFMAYTMAHGQELWVTDGTAAGTRLVADLEPGPGSSMIRGPLTVVGDDLYFSAITTGAGRELWALRVRCRADFDGSEGAGLADLFAFLSAWLASEAGADFDGDGLVGVPDVFAFLSAWFAGCG